MPDHIVFLDANVVVAASIVQEPGGVRQIKHRLHDESSRLIERLAELKIGYIVPTVERESYGALERAVEELMRQKDGNRAELREWEYKDYVDLVYSSSKRMKKLLASMTEVRPDTDSVAQCLWRVAQMSSDLKGKYEDEMARLGRAVTSGGRRGGPDWAVLPPALWQLGRFMRQYPNSGDQRVLAAVAAFGEEVARGPHMTRGSSRRTATPAGRRTR